MSSDLNKWEETLRQCKCLDESEMKRLCRMVKALLLEEPNLRCVSSPATICGDIHGQYIDLLHLFEVSGELDDKGTTNTHYIFLGDLVDRGFNSVETLSLLFVLKAKYPDRITLLRGNHESRQVTTIYGFFEECQNKYGTNDVWFACVDVFDFMPIGALIDGKTFCVHGGLSPEIRSLDQLSILHRRREIPSEGPFCDLMWSDPENVDGWAVSQRGAGYLFGPTVQREFSHINGLQLICRAHQLAQEGYKYHFDEERLVTVWSAPNYCYRCGNLASVLRIFPDQSRQFVVFKEVERQCLDAHASCPSYFL
jgi:diadenosine tetraphosphatase ApaH/serine/threonine PP2A family protein phosphatase